MRWLVLGVVVTVACGEGESDDTPSAGKAGMTASQGGSRAKGGSGGNGGSGNQAGSNVPAQSKAGTAGTAAAVAGSSGAGGGSAGTTGAGGHAMAGSGGTAGTDADAGGAGGDTGGEAGGGNAAGAAGTAGSPAVKCDPGCGSHKWACWPMPNPAGSGLPNEASYTDLGDTVVDDITCLEWEKAPADDRIDWPSAIAHCNALELGGSSDWRLPTRVELASITRFSEYPWFDTDVFAEWNVPNAWTSSAGYISVANQHPVGEGISWLVYTSAVNTDSQMHPWNVRCVRGGGEGEGPLEPAVQPADHYSEPSSGEVRDNYTGLVWQKSQSPSTMPFAEAARYCAMLTLGGHGWRVPTGQELQTLVDETRQGPAVDVDAFPDLEWEDFIPYWASPTSTGDSPPHLALMMGDAYFFGPTDDEGWVKCVR